MISIEDVTAAFDRKDYREVAKLLKALRKQSPQNPWVEFYIGKYYEETGKLDAAEKAYGKVLREIANPKVISQARAGLKRVEAIPKERRKQAIAQAKQDPTQLKPGLLVLEPINPDRKTELAKQFARIMQLQPYSARLLLPTRSWRMYRTGAIGELQVFVKELRQVGIPCFCATLEQINRLRVFRINYFETLSPQATVICTNEADQQGKLPFKWSEVSQIVSGILPIFKEVAVENHRRTEVNYKQEIHEYIGVMDLHLYGRGCILRLCEDSYEFDNGYSFIPSDDTSGKRSKSAIDSMSMHLKWQRLVKHIQQQLPQVNMVSDFTPFAETAIPEEDMLERIKPHLDLFRFAPSVWDNAFALYSGLVFLKPSL
jgi:tetratricopeptide (TPR) repeat protein